MSKIELLRLSVCFFAVDQELIYVEVWLVVIQWSQVSYSCCSL